MSETTKSIDYRPPVSTDSKLSKLPEERKAPVQKETQDKLSNNPENLFPKASLDKIGVSVAEVKILAKEVLGIDNFKLPDSKKLIEAYQKNHNIDDDGKIGKETYLEMKAGEVLEKAQYKVEQFGISPETQKEILFVLEKANPKGTNLIKLLDFLCNFRKKHKNEPKYKNFFDSIDYSFQNNEYKGKIEKELKGLKNENGGSLYHDVKEVWKNDKLTTKQKLEKTYARAKGPAALILGVAFLFGMFGANTDFTNSFWKRALVLFGGLTLGGGEAIDDLIKMGIEATGKGTKAATKAYNETAPEVSRKANEVLSAISSTFSGAVDSIKKIELKDFEPSFGTVISGIESDNKVLDKSEQIPENSLEKLNNILLKDTKFLSVKKEDLGKLNKDNLNTYLSADSIKKLGEDKKYLAKYSILLKQQFKDGDLRLRDIFFTTGMFDNLVESFAKIDTPFTHIPEIDKEANEIIHGLITTDNKEYKLAGIELYKAILNNSLDSFDISLFDLDSNLKTRIENLLKKIKEYYKSYKPLEEKINNIDVSNDNKLSLEADYNIFVNLIKDKNFNSPELKTAFEKLKTKKEKEFIEKAEELGMEKLGEKTIETIDNKITNLEKELNNIEIKDSLSLEDYKTKKEDLDKILKKYEVLAKEIDSNIGDKIKEFFNNIANKLGQSSLFEIDRLSEIDKQKALKLNNLLVKIQNKNVDLHDALKITIAGINSTYLSKIQNVSSIAELDGVKREYEIELRGIPREFVGDEVEKAYENQKEALEKAQKIGEEAEKALKSKTKKVLQPKIKPSNNEDTKLEAKMQEYIFKHDIYYKIPEYKEFYDYLVESTKNSNKGWFTEQINSHLTNEVSSQELIKRLIGTSNRKIVNAKDLYEQLKQLKKGNTQNNKLQEKIQKLINKLEKLK